MIKELKRIIVNENGTEVSMLPSNETIINKVNEIIRYLNARARAAWDESENPFEPRNEG
ncbi:hypothetical protein [Lederbergia lenta]|uniref:hypothetical protein n=1 Tax=Lederbergia lenta TaxID=1467 RepID=UPI00203ACFA5|nr:hypothetical protein [Lederbergia lenta]MCM3109951.1 hypothetical protein [Lederbergia lenta]